MTCLSGARVLQEDRGQEEQAGQGEQSLKCPGTCESLVCLGKYCIESWVWPRQSVSECCGAQAEAGSQSTCVLLNDA